MSGLGAVLGFPLGDAGEIFVPGPVDHQAVGADRLLQQFRGGAHPRIQALVRAPLGTSNRLEGVLWTLLTLTGIADAEGAFLDEWGEIVGLERDGETDTRYRELLYARLYALRSAGTIEHLNRVMTALDATWVGGIDNLDGDPELDPATFRLSWTSPVLDDHHAEQYRRFLKSARAAGVKCHFYSWPAPEATLFMFRNDAGAPVADFDHGFNAGVFAREEIA